MSSDFNVTVTKVVSQAANRFGAAVNQALDEAFSVFDDVLDAKKLTGKTSKVTRETVDGVKQVRLEVEVPGCGKDDVSITAAGTTVTVSWKSRIDGQDRACQFSVGKQADFDTISAKVENGYLTIVVKKKEDEKDEPKKIRVD